MAEKGLSSVLPTRASRVAVLFPVSLRHHLWGRFWTAEQGAREGSQPLPPPPLFMVIHKPFLTDSFHFLRAGLPTMHECSAVAWPCLSVYYSFYTLRECFYQHNIRENQRETILYPFLLISPTRESKHHHKE